jgi:L-ascorbate metabolism protein UlaG (beta-lactamase superfamily)
MTENIEVFTQSSIRIKDGSRTIYIDPFQMREEPKDADYILITHDHYDHFSPEDIAKVSCSNTVLIVPERMLETAKQVSDLVEKIVAVKPGVYCEVTGLELETIPAYNILKPFHPKNAGWVGYILRIDGKRIYIAGDTDDTKECKAVRCDIALVPIGGTYTMDAKKAAELINTIRPEVAIPTHYGSIVGKPGDGETFAKYVKPPIRVEFKISFLTGQEET